MKEDQPQLYFKMCNCWKCPNFYSEIRIIDSDFTTILCRIPIPYSAPVTPTEKQKKKIKKTIKQLGFKDYKLNQLG